MLWAGMGDERETMFAPGSPADRADGGSQGPTGLPAADAAGPDVPPLAPAFNADASGRPPGTPPLVPAPPAKPAGGARGPEAPSARPPASPDPPPRANPPRPPVPGIARPTVPPPSPPPSGPEPVPPKDEAPAPVELPADPNPESPSGAVPAGPGPSAPGATAIDPAQAELDRKLEAAVQRGIAYLIANQRLEGVWGKSRDEYGDDFVPITALGALALLAQVEELDRLELLRRVDNACGFLLSQKTAMGYISSVREGMFGHAFGCLLLAERCSRDREWFHRGEVESALDFCWTSQNQDGGWGYEPGQRCSEIVVSLCVLCALRSGERAGFAVDEKKMRAAEAYIALHRTRVDPKDLDPECGLFFYVPGIGRSKESLRTTSYPITAAAMAVLLPSLARGDPMIAHCVDYLLGQRPYLKSRLPIEDPYHSLFCATQFFADLGGEPWKKWKESALKELADRQAEDGSWARKFTPKDPCFYGPYYATALSVLCLSAGKQRLTLFRPVEKE